MFEERKLRKILLKLIDQAQGFGLPETDINNAKEFIKEGEYDCCLDILVQQSYEYSIAINEQFYELVNEAANKMKLPESGYVFLRELVKLPPLSGRS